MPAVGSCDRRSGWGRAAVDGAVVLPDQAAGVIAPDDRATAGGRGQGARVVAHKAADIGAIERGHRAGGIRTCDCAPFDDTDQAANLVGVVGSDRACRIGCADVATVVPTRQPANGLAAIAGDIARGIRGARPDPSKSTNQSTHIACKPDHLAGSIRTLYRIDVAAQPTYGVHATDLARSIRVIDRATGVVADQTTNVGRVALYFACGITSAYPAPTDDTSQATGLVTALDQAASVRSAVAGATHTAGQATDIVSSKVVAAVGLQQAGHCASGEGIIRAVNIAAQTPDVVMVGHHIGRTAGVSNPLPVTDDATHIVRIGGDGSAALGVIDHPARIACQSTGSVAAFDQGAGVARVSDARIRIADQATGVRP